MTPSALIDAVSHHLPASGRLGVAYSGGVDSATLLAIAVRCLGPDRVVALMAVSSSLAARERSLALSTAASMGVSVVELETNEQDIPQYRANDVDRCYYCKNEMFSVISASDVGVDFVAYGENADDAVRIDRPGAVAATEHSVLRPLAAAGLTKSQVREVARFLELPVADKPAAPCLASRIPHGHEVTPEKLAQVEALELALYQFGFSDSRVRHHGEIARIELPRPELTRAVELADDIQAAAVRAGFTYAALDLKGIQSGAMTLSILNARGSL